MKVSHTSVRIACQPLVRSTSLLSTFTTLSLSLLVLHSGTAMLHVQTKVPWDNIHTWHHNTFVQRAYTEGLSRIKQKAPVGKPELGIVRSG